MTKSEDLLLKLIESNARIESKIDGLEQRVSEIKREADQIEERVANLELGIAGFKGKVTGIALVLSIAVSLVIQFFKEFGK